ncbi:MAG: phosphoribosylformylglycinamidine synthase [Lachnospiraceae bacterium]|nr:phosphoribosylformylglycinamidine synthase [Lachnospiraceae bacterium]
MVYRVYVEKKDELAHEAHALAGELQGLLGIAGLRKARIINRYDIENISEKVFEQAKRTIFSEPQTDLVSDEVDLGESFCFAVEYLPGQFDQRADSAMQCVRIIAPDEDPLIRSAVLYSFTGDLTEADHDKIRQYLINPVEAREAALDLPETLKMTYEIPEEVAVLTGFRDMDEKALPEFIAAYGLAMDAGDIAFCQEYFRSEQRDPTMTELRVIDTYWSDHCRHTTFHTQIDDVSFEDELLQKAYDEYLAVRKELGRTKPVCLMDLGTLAAKYLREKGLLDKLDESEEVNACTVRIEMTVDGKKEPWLLFFKNETHNHPTEIEPFGGAATCIGGAIRDPLSGRGYVYGAMRVTGAADPLKAISETIPGKLPQRTIVTKAAAGYSSYGNQIGLATGIVDELYHPGYVAKRMEVGAVIAAAPAENVRRERPSAGDVVILLGGATGRDGCGGATGSSKSHTLQSLETCGAEVQKGNAPEERKLQRMFRRHDVCSMIKRCNDFGAGGVSVAIGELAEGLEIDLNAVPKKYEGLDGTELAISESQERMAVVVAPEDVARFLSIAGEENTDATPVAVVTDSGRLIMHWNGKAIVDISHAFLDTNGAPKHICIKTEKTQEIKQEIPGSFVAGYMHLAGDLKTCSRRGLAERFDSTIGAGTVLMPFGGKYQLTPAQTMVQKVSVQEKETDTVSLMAYGFNPYISEKSPYHGAYLAVVESVCKLIAAGASFKDIYLSFQEFFGSPKDDPRRWGLPLAALLGAFKAQIDLGVGAIGGKDSMSGSFEDLDVPPTLISFAVTTDELSHVVSPEFKEPDHDVVMIMPSFDASDLPEASSLKTVFETITVLMRKGLVKACYTPGCGGVAEAVMKICFGNGLGFSYNSALTLEDIFGYRYGGFVIETDNPGAVRELVDANSAISCVALGKTLSERVICYHKDTYELSAMLRTYEDKLESVYRTRTESGGEVPTISYEKDKLDEKPASFAVHCDLKPRVLIPVFPGTNCEYDSAAAVRRGGAEPEIFVVHDPDHFAEAVRRSQMIFIPGGFSAGDEPDGSGKFITSFFRNDAVRDAVEDLMDHRDGLMLGICNGFQALIKLGLVPFGRITDTDADAPTLTHNVIGRHQSRIVRTRIASNKSPWLSLTEVGDVYTVPVSHGEGRFYANQEWIGELIRNGQIATQYVDFDGQASMDVLHNPNGSVYAVEGITSPDGRILGKMGHSERYSAGLYQNVPGNYDSRIFEAAVRYFR